MRHDTFLTTLGSRGERGYSRLWVEDSAGRLSRNGFGMGDGFEVRPRAGLGLIVRPAILSSTHVSSRRGSAILSYESKDLPTYLRGVSEARVRISVNAMILMPALRLFAVARPLDEVWSIAGNILSRPNGCQPIDGAMPARFDATPARLNAALTEQNLVFATEVMSHAKPAEISLSGSDALTALAGQFLAAIGYEKTPEGVYAR